DVGSAGVAGESNTIRIGNQVAFTDQDNIMHPAHTQTFVAGVSGTTVSGGVAVVVNSSGQLGTMSSSARFKDDIKPMDYASKSIFALKPVTFRYKKELDPERVPQFGLVAEDVAKVNPDLVLYDAKGALYTVRYEAVNAMLLNEFLKEHRTVQEQGSTITALRANDAKQEATIARQQKQIEQLTAAVQKVSAQLELSNSAPQTVLNNH